MTRAKIEREVAAAVLSGDEPVPKLLRAGLVTLLEVRRQLSDPLEAAFERGDARDYVWTALPRGGKLLVHLRHYTTPDKRTSPSLAQHACRAAPLVTLVRARSGKTESAVHTDMHTDTNYVGRRQLRVLGAIDLLTARLGADATAIVRSMLAIERARKQCYALAEEATRWL